MRFKRTNLPKQITSPITNDVLDLKDNSDHNDCPLSVAQFFDTSTEYFDSVVMYQNDATNEIIYIPIDEEDQ